MTKNTCKIPTDVTLTTPRLILRLPVEEDEEAARQILSDTRTMKYLRFMTHEPTGWTREEVHERIKGHVEEQSQGLRLTFHILERSKPVEPQADPLNPEGLKILRIFEDLEDTKQKHSLVGFCGLNHINWTDLQTSMGIILHHSFQSKGYGTEALYLTAWYAFEVLHIHRLVVETTESNEGMRGWMEDLCGVEVESVRKECIRLDENTWLDSWDYAILEDQWRGFVKDRLETKLGWKASI